MAMPKLGSLEIRNFRAFKHLKIERLRPVNLITGKNNTGKTCLLEALWLYANRGSLSAILELLEARDEYLGGSIPPRRVIYSIRSSSDRDSEEVFLAIRHLYHGRGDDREPFGLIEIGPVDPQTDVLSISIDQEDGRDNYPISSITVRMGEEETAYGLDERKTLWEGPGLSGVSSVFVSANGLASGRISRLWDNVALTDLEEDMLASLRIITAQIERVTLVGEQESALGRRVPIVKVSGIGRPVPLRSMGEGMNRLFGITLALVNAKEGILLIDEIDSGLHYSVLQKVWQLIFAVAHRLNVQVFATTHSWDCVKAFQKAAAEDEHEEGILIRLSEKEGQITPTLFDGRRLGIATREQIEVR